MSDAVMEGKVAEVIYRRAIEMFSGMLQFQQPIFCRDSYLVEVVVYFKFSWDSAFDCGTTMRVSDCVLYLILFLFQMMQISGFPSCRFVSCFRLQTKLKKKYLKSQFEHRLQFDVILSMDAQSLDTVYWNEEIKHATIVFQIDRMS